MTNRKRTIQDRNRARRLKNGSLEHDPKDLTAPQVIHFFAGAKPADVPDVTTPGGDGEEPFQIVGETKLAMAGAADQLEKHREGDGKDAPPASDGSASDPETGKPVELPTVAEVLEEGKTADGKKLKAADREVLESTVADHGVPASDGENAITPEGEEVVAATGGEDADGDLVIDTATGDVEPTPADAPAAPKGSAKG